MPLFKQERTRENVRLLTQAMHKIFDYYIRFYLFQGGCHDKHENYPDNYQEMYVNCIKLLSDVSIDKTTDFNRIKRYFNKSVQGWIHNKLYLVKKRKVDYLVDDALVNIHIDNKNHFLEVDYAADLAVVDAHIASEVHFYFELLSTMFGPQVYKKKSFYEKRFREAVYYRFLKSGNLISAIDFFESKYGAVFHQEEAVTA